MGEERKEACLLCLPCDLALCVVFFPFYQLPRKETSGEERAEPLLCGGEISRRLLTTHWQATSNKDWAYSQTTFTSLEFTLYILSFCTNSGPSWPLITRLLFSDEGKDHRDENSFFEALGSRGNVKDASEGGDDVAFEKTSQQSVTLYRY